MIQYFVERPMKEIIIQGVDNYPLCLHIFEAQNPKAIVQIIHGMEEYQDRYNDFASFLANNGYTVVSANLRGHGKTATTLGYFADKGGYKLLIDDAMTIRNWIGDNYPNLPVSLFAHSMGTIIGRVLLQSQSKMYDKVILSGYPNYKSAVHIGKFVGSIIKAFKGAKHKSKFLEKLTLGVNNKNIKNPHSPIDWLCSDPKVIQAYFTDKYCGHGFTVSGFIDLYQLLINMKKYKKYHDINTDLSLLLLAGLDDPCTGGQKGREQSIKTLYMAGFRDIEHIEYKDMRHEILNEKNHQIVYDDILSFLDK